MRAYFAYGSNMDRVQMASRCPGASPTGIARLPAHRVVFVNDLGGFDGGVATIVPDAEHDVWGVLWHLGDAHIAALDEWEDYPRAYDRVTRAVLAPEPVDALVYVATIVRPERPRPAYLDGILRGASDAGLPGEYVERLRRWADETPPEPGGDPATEPRR